MSNRKIAEEYAPGSELVVVDRWADGSCALLSREEALAEGYEIVPSRSHSLASDVSVTTEQVTIPEQAAGDVPRQRVNAATLKLAWLAAITSSAEAKGREAAVNALVATHSPDTLSVDQARSFLRGLPLEISEPPKAPTVTNTEDPRAARKAEIANSVASFNADRGYGRRAAPAKVSAPNTAGVDQVKLKRFAELRLNALDSGHAHDAGGEAKKLRYALEVHDTTGAPLADMFARLNVDTSKFIR
jgi:hypothetical protein